MDIKKLIPKFKLKKKSWVFVIATVLIASTIGYGSKYWFGNDNVLEQRAEQFIEKTTGYSIDFSPEYQK